MLCAALLEVQATTILNEPERALVFLENEGEGIMIWRYFLEKVGTIHGIRDEVYGMMSAVLEAIIQSLPGVLERFLEHIFLNPDIWTHASKEGQDGVLRKAMNLIEEYPDTFRPVQLIDILMHNVEVLCVIGEVKADTILQISGLVLILAKGAMNEAVLAKIVSYANVYYARRNKCYPYQLYYVCCILLNLFNSGMISMIF